MARGDLLWTPSAEMVERATMTRFMRDLDRGFESYDDLWRWSVEDLDGFWAAIWDRFGVEGSYDRVLARREMPGAEWFPAARLNYAEHLLRDREGTAIVHRSELRET
ncbi:MAG TPA: acetyl-coenzyme A synthetase N-terminal domain-containing protein, partial [Solirubrobacteraceae bacterium]|nr:acetyl-coenzyme A synthetase N-terminal domain-containing protein [Solirubrobacteraceae bacterium]